MAKGTVYTEKMKEELREKMCEVCERSWKERGYKKTNIKEFCTELGISIGSFYSLFDNKEELFCETMEKIQKNLMNRLYNILYEVPSQAGFMKAVSDLYREYDKTPFLYEVNTEDFLSFVNKLPKEKVLELQVDIEIFFKKAIDIANLELKVSSGLAIGTLSALLSTINSKKSLDETCNHIKIFDFMLKAIIGELFYER